MDYSYPNNAKAQLDYIILINKKRINSALNCKAYLPFKGISSNHRIVMAKICLSQLRNKKQTVKTTHYDWSSLTNGDISNRYSVTVRKKLDTLQDTSERYTLNDEYENFVTSQMEAVVECILTKLKAKCNVP